MMMNQTKSQSLAGPIEVELLIHVLPQEIMLFQQLMLQLKHCSTHITESQRQVCKFTLSVVLNGSLVDWNASQLPMTFVVSSFKHAVAMQRDWAHVHDVMLLPPLPGSAAAEEEAKSLDTRTALTAQTAETHGNDGIELNYPPMAPTTSIRGVNDWRRVRVQETTAQALLFMDPDMVFGPQLLLRLTAAAVALTSATMQTGLGQYWVVTPQCPPMWDSSWSVLTPDSWLQEGCSRAAYDARDPYLVTGSLTSSSQLRQLPLGTLKWGGGLCSMFSVPLLRFAAIPESLGPYGQDDLTVMVMCQAMQRHCVARPHLRMHQYVLTGEVVTENVRYRNMIEAPMLVTKARMDVQQFRRQANAMMMQAVKQFCLANNLS